MWLGTLRENGTDADLTDAARRLTLRSGDAVASWMVRRLRRIPRPSEVSSIETGQVLWLPGLTAGLRKRLLEIGASWVTDAGEVHLDAPWGLVSQELPRPVEESASAGEVEATLSPGAVLVLQFLLEHPAPATQQRIASAVGLSQPRVSQVLKELGGDDLVERVADGWLAARPERGFDVVVAADPMVSALTLTWYGLATPRRQLAAIWHQAEIERAEVRLCGDWAADLLAPWRQPGLIVVHADRTLDLDSAGFVPAPPASATVAVQVGPIRADWRPEPHMTAALTKQPIRWPLAPVTEIAREIAATGGSDAGQAIAELRAEWLRVRSDTPIDRKRYW